MTADQKAAVFTLASQILTAAKATENDKFAVYTYFSFGHTLVSGKEIYGLEVIPQAKDENGNVIRDKNDNGIPYDTEECPKIRICCAELQCDNCFEVMMTQLKQAASKLGIIC